MTPGRVLPLRFPGCRLPSSFSPVPSALITQIWLSLVPAAFVRLLLKAICVPSGDQIGS